MSFFPAVIKWEKWLVLNTRLRSIFWVKNILFQQPPVMKRIFMKKLALTCLILSIIYHQAAAKYILG